MNLSVCSFWDLVSSCPSCLRTDSSRKRRGADKAVPSTVESLLEQTWASASVALLHHRVGGVGLTVRQNDLRLNRSIVIPLKLNTCQSFAGHFKAFWPELQDSVWLQSCMNSGASGPLGFSDSPLGQTEQIPARVALAMKLWLLLSPSNSLLPKTHSAFKVKTHFSFWHPP